MICFKIWEEFFFISNGRFEKWYDECSIGYMTTWWNVMKSEYAILGFSMYIPIVLKVLKYVERF